MRQMEHIGGVLKRFLKGNRLDRRVAEYEAVSAWKGIVGEEIAAHSTALGLRRGLLWVSVAGSVWIQHIMFLKPKILLALREEYPDVRITDIRCVIRGRDATR